MAHLPFSTPAHPPTLKLEPFSIAVPSASLDALKQLLRLAPLAPLTHENRGDHPGGELGVSRAWLAATKKVWQGEFDWRRSEERMNAFPHFKTVVKDAHGDDFELHFMALFSQHPKAVPLLCLHGWPGSFLEFLPIFRLLASSHTPATLPYTLVVPSLPGFGFSGAPPLDRPFRYQDAAFLMHQLMAGLFGERGYVVHGGDIGSRVARILAVEHARCKAIHLNFCCIFAPPAGVPVDAVAQYTPLDRAAIAKSEAFLERNSSYAREQGTRPATVGLTLASSPLALLAWLGEKFLEWPHLPLATETILESVSLYWLTDTIATSLWAYRQDVEPAQTAAHDHPSLRIPASTPLGFSAFAHEIAPVPRAWVAATTAAGAVAFWQDHAHGGHFAALECPDVLWADMDCFFGGLVELHS